MAGEERKTEVHSTEPVTLSGEQIDSLLKGYQLALQNLTGSHLPPDGWVGSIAMSRDPRHARMLYQLQGQVMLYEDLFRTLGVSERAQVIRSETATVVFREGGPLGTIRTVLEKDLPSGE